jgi:hypothetical protein
MSSVTIESKGQYKCIVLCDGHWDKTLKKVVSTKIYIEKVNNISGDYQFKEEFLKNTPLDSVEINNEIIDLNKYKKHVLSDMISE